MEIPAGYEEAAEAALGERLGFMLVRDRAAAVRALEYLRAGEHGRCGIHLPRRLCSGTPTWTPGLAGRFRSGRQSGTGRTAGRGPSGSDQRRRIFSAAWGLVIGGRRTERRQRPAGPSQGNRRPGRPGSGPGRGKGAPEGIWAGKPQPALQSLEAARAEAEEDGRAKAAALVEVEKRQSSLGGRQGELQTRPQWSGPGPGKKQGAEGRSSGTGSGNPR